MKVLCGVRSAFLIGMLMSFSLAFDARAQDECKTHYHMATGSGTSLLIARKTAVGAWQAQVRAHDGDLWSGWSLACNKTLKCHSFSTAKYTCTANGRPGAIL
jgi:hypothetical protein